MHKQSLLSGTAPHCLRTSLSDAGHIALQEWHEGAHAVALAAYWGVERLPGAVLVPPFCHVATCEVQQPHRPKYPAQ